MDPFTDYLRWLDNQPVSRRRTLLCGFALTSVTLVTAVTLLLPAAAPMAGATAGLGLFAAVYGWWATLAPARQRDRFDLKAAQPLLRRRALIVTGAVLWAIALLLAGGFLPGPLLGTLNVFTVLTLIRLWQPTDIEAAHLHAAQSADGVAASEAADGGAHPDA